jgi:hypothetical protein
MDASHSDDEAGGCGCCSFFTRKGRRQGIRQPGRRQVLTYAVTDNPPTRDSEATPLLSAIDRASITESDSLDDVPEDASPNSKPISEQRLRAEARFKTANAKLQKAIPNTDNKLQIPDAVSLSGLDDIEDVEGTAKLLESAIEKFIHSRNELNANPKREMVKKCITGWFNASFPYVKQNFNTVKVCRGY